MKTRILRCLLAIAFAATAASAQQMNYQGRLTDNAGAPRPGPQATLTFSMWTLPTGGTKVWGDFALNADLIDGRFSVKLGTATGADGTGRLLSNAFATNPGPRYLEIKVGTDAPLPRQEVLPAPTALHAVIAGTVPDGAIGTNQLANFAVTGAKIADNTISVAKLTGAGANFWDGNGTNVWRTGGRVGIGTASPVTALHVLSAVSTEISVDSTAATGGKRYTLQSGSTGRFSIIDRDAGVNRFSVLNGNIGIGTTTPSALLDIRNSSGANESLRLSGAAFNATGGTSTQGISFLLGLNTDDLSRTDLMIGNSRKLAATDSVVRILPGIGDVSFIDSVTPTGSVFKDLSFQGNSMRILANGNVGIGTTAPTVAKLVVNGAVSGVYTGGSTLTGTFPNYEGNSDAYTSNGANTLGGGNTTIPLSIWASNSIMGTSFIAKSDKRIKDVVGQSDNHADLALINRLRVTDYRMKDRVAYGPVIQKGLIAQEVEAIIPEAVSRTQAFIPDVYEPAVRTTFDSNQKILTLEMAKPHQIAVGDKIQVHADKETLETEVLAVSTPTTFSVKASSPVKRAFVFGRQVDDFMAVNYDRIFTTAVGAVQELARKLEASEAKLAALHAENAALKAELVQQAAKDRSIEARLALLEAKDQARDAKMASIEKALGSSDQPATRTISLKQGE